MFLIKNFISQNAIPVAWQTSFQKPATTMMEGIIDLHHDIFAFLIIILTFVSLMLLTILVRYINPFFKQVPFMKFLTGHNITHNTQLEIIWTILPTLILLIIATPSFALIYALDESIEPQLTIRCIGRQWYWTYEYPDNVKAQILNLVNQTNYNVKIPGFNLNSYLLPVEDLFKGTFRLLEVDKKIYIPVQTNVRLLVTSYDVIHSWAIPSFGVKMDAIPGRLNEYFLKINFLGNFYGQCSEICGVNHGFMPIKVAAVTKIDFAKWYLTTSVLETNYLKFKLFVTCK